MLFRLPSEEELTDNKLNEFIAKHNAECAFRFKHLKDAYETDYQIFHQKPKPDYKPDNRIKKNLIRATQKSTDYCRLFILDKSKSDTLDGKHNYKQNDIG